MSLVSFMTQLWQTGANRSLRNQRRRRRGRGLSLEVLEDRCLLTTYAITDLGTLGEDSYAYRISPNGRVVGYSEVSDDSYHAFLWTRGHGIQDLGTLPGYPDFVNSEATGINDSGKIVGYAGADLIQRRGFLYRNGTMIDLGTLGGPYSNAYDINEAGQITGHGDVAPSVGHAFFWDRTHGFRDLGTFGGRNSDGYGINQLGWVTGWGDLPDGGRHAAFWHDGIMTDLGTLGGRTSLGVHLNNLGHIVGNAYLADDTTLHAFFWDSTNGMQDLGTFGDQPSHALGINDADVVVGFTGVDQADLTDQGFIWDKVNGLRNLNDLVPDSGWNITYGTDINDAGEIVGYGFNPEGEDHAFLMEPDIGPVVGARLGAAAQAAFGSVSAFGAVRPPLASIPDASANLIAATEANGPGGTVVSGTGPFAVGIADIAGNFHLDQVTETGTPAATLVVQAPAAAVVLTLGLTGTPVLDPAFDAIPAFPGQAT
jgi:probable HAF family extracellular repeat protein